MLTLVAHILKLDVYEVHRNTYYTSYNTEGNYVELSSGFFVDTHGEKKLLSSNALNRVILPLFTLSAPL